MLRKLLMCILLGCLFMPWSISIAQGQQTGTIEALAQDDGSITISGQRVGFADGVTEVYIGDRLIGAHNIDVGMVVRYTLDASGVLLRVELLGPNDKLNEIDLH
jgi:hypothetical protein